MSIKYPFGPADVQAPEYAGTLALTITNQKTIVDVDLTGACTVNLTIDDEVIAGAELLIVASSDGTARTLTPGTGFTGVAVAGVISKTKSMKFEYNGSTFVYVSSIQID